MHSTLKITAMGGGTGTHTVLSGLKSFPEVELAAVVSIADNGGSSGQLRDEFGILPPGDIRQCLVALAEAPEELRELLNDPEGGHPLGNLIIKRLIRKHGDPLKGIQAAHRVFQVRGEVIPVSATAANLVAELEDGGEIRGEHKIDTEAGGRAPIRRCFLDPSVDPNPAAIRAILTSDVIVLGPGDLYTSLVPVLLVPGIADALAKTAARLLFVVNLVTKRGQTDGYGASRFVRTVEAHLDGRGLDRIILNTGSIDHALLAKYEHAGDAYVVDDLPAEDARVLRGDFVGRKPIVRREGDMLPRSLIRHDDSLARAIMDSIRKEAA